MFRLTISIYESKPYPIVVHVFQGTTKQEALNYYSAHLQTDKFLHDCLTKKKWRNVKCRVETKLEENV